VRIPTLASKFVDNISDDVVSGVLYACIRYATVVHLCCCGCDNEVITPLTPTDWSLTFDGATVSLSPSVGNWSCDCRSTTGYVTTEWNGLRCGLWRRSNTRAPGPATSGRTTTDNTKSLLPRPEPPEPSTCSGDDLIPFFATARREMRKWDLRVQLWSSARPGSDSPPWATSRRR
jgi:hypothetical protein